MADTCIVIGAAGGIGSELCRKLSAGGWQLVLAGRTGDSLKQLADELGQSVTATSTLDAQDFAATEALFDAHKDAVAAVNLAGSIILKPAHSTSEQEFNETFDQNIRTAFSVTRAAAKTMRGHGGSVVLMSSCAAGFGLPNHEAISAAKAAVEGLVRSAAASYAPANLRINAVAPGLTDTPLASRLTSNDASRKASEAMHPLGRIGAPSDIASAIEFLVQPGQSWITGQVIGVDGGLARVKARG